MANDGFFGLTNHQDTFGMNDISKYGAWGFKDDTTKETSSRWQCLGNDCSERHRPRISGGDRLGLLVDQRSAGFSSFATVN